jgi:competence protein ComEA
MDENGPVPRSTLRIVAAAVLASLATAVVLGAVLLFVRRDDNAPIQVVLPPSAQSEAAELRVYVKGAVHNPGVYTLRPGDRVEDAIAAAGGATGDANLAAVNLAHRIKDEEQIDIRKVGETGPPGNATDQGPGTPSDCDLPGKGLIDLNAASVDLLQTLPGIGQVRAEAVVRYREQTGPFRSVEGITNVSGIGPATYESIRELVTVCDGR